MRLRRVTQGLFAILFGTECTQAEAADPAVGIVRTTTPEPSATTPPVQADVTSASQAQSPDEEKKWKFATIAYVWFAGAQGQTDVIGPAEPVGLDLSFGDVLNSLKFAFMGAAEARRDRIVILGDLTFIHLDTKKGLGIRDPDFLEAELDSRTAEITLLGGYRVLNSRSVDLDLLAGARMNFFKASLELEGPSRSAEGSETQNWLDPVVAARAKAPLGGKWGLSLYGDLGGIIFGSDITWQGTATVDYQINRKMSVGAGWRHFKVHYDRGDFLYDVAQSGPLITFRTEL